jgi:hypothetical protein
MREPKDEPSIETLTASLQKTMSKKYHEIAISQSIHPMAGPVESRSLAIWGIEGMKVPETKTSH